MSHIYTPLSSIQTTFLINAVLCRRSLMHHRNVRLRQYDLRSLDYFAVVPLWGKITIKADPFRFRPLNQPQALQNMLCNMRRSRNLPQSTQHSQHIGWCIAHLKLPLWPFHTKRETIYKVLASYTSVRCGVWPCVWPQRGMSTQLSSACLRN